VKISKPLTAMLVAGSVVSAQAGTILSEDFDNVAALTGAGWAQVTTSVGAGSGWFQGNSGVFPAASGAADSYAAANFVGATTISDWLMSPVINVLAGSSLNFSLRLLGVDFGPGLPTGLDTVEVYTSNNGASTSIGDFTLLTSYTAGADTGWTLNSLNLPAFNGRVAFRYFVADTTFDGNYVGLDSVSVVPEPTSVALVALALAGLAASRRRA
jgi:PEP-CTERM motif